MWTIEWADGSTTSAPSAHSLVDELAAINGTTRSRVGTVLADRALQLRDALIDPALPPERLLSALDRVGLFKVTHF